MYVLIFANFLKHFICCVCLQYYIDDTKYVYIVCLIFCRGGKQIVVLEDVKRQVLHGTLEVQKCFNGHLACQDFSKLKGAVVTLQSCKLSLTSNAS